MRRFALPGAYERLKEATRGKRVEMQDLRTLIEGLAIPEADKARLLALTPAGYIGKAAELARRV
jgi:adenylosuccinate lyase